jgi:dipeptidyl aminopeptidase/acylaminoacyl peptidase
VTRPAALTPELIAGAGWPEDPVISPDGRWVAWVARPASDAGAPVSRVWAAPADGSAPARPVSSGAGRDRLPRWAAGSAELYYACGGEVRAVRPVGGPERTVWRGDGEIVGLVPVAGGRHLAVIAPDPAPAADPVVWGEDIPASRLRLLDTGTGRAVTVAGLAGRHVTEAAARPGGGPLAVISWDCPPDEPGALTARLHVVDPGTGQARDLGPAGLDARDLAWWQAADGWHLAWLRITPPGVVGGMAVFDVPVPAAPEGANPGAASPGADGAGAGHRNLTDGLDRCPEELAQVAAGPPLAVLGAGLDTEISRLDPATLRFRLLARGPGRVRGLTASAAGDVIAARLSTPGEPEDVWAGPPDGPLRRLSDISPGLRGRTWGVQERLTWVADDGLALDGLLVLPPGASRADGPFSLVTLVHGGPYDRYADRLQLFWWPSAQWLAAAGHAVFLPNPRGSQGRGHQFAATVAGAVGLGEFTDIMTGIDALVADGVADPARLGIGGWSHGGFMAAWAVGQTQRFRAAVMGAGISDWGMQAGVGELGRQESGLGGSAGWEGPGPHRHDQLSPVSYAARVSTPVLILHGEDDTNVPVGQAIYFHRAISQFSSGHQLVIYPREQHSFRERDHITDQLRRVRDWFGRWLAEPGPAA